MDALATATATATAVSAVGSHFMLDGGTYAKGAGLGFSGLDFYAAGRGGVLGEVDADVVAAAFAFFEPAYVRAQWDQGRSVMPPARAADAWASACADWAEAHVGDDAPVERMAELLDPVVGAARPACASIFSGWRALPVPTAPKAHAVHQMNALRELRHGLHSAAVVSAGLTPHQALSLRTPGMVPIFGWPEAAPVEGLQGRWDAAEAATDTAIAHAYDALDDGQRDELAGLLDELTASIS
jgi:hypothetical protein